MQAHNVHLHRMVPSQSACGLEDETVFRSAVSKTDSLINAVVRPYPGLDVGSIGTIYFERSIPCALDSFLDIRIRTNGECEYCHDRAEFHREEPLRG